MVTGQNAPEGFLNDESDADDFMNALIANNGRRFDYDNMNEFKAYCLAEFARGYHEKVERLQASSRDNQRFAVRPEFAGRAVARITTEDAPIPVSSIHNRSYRPDEATWMLECVACEGPTHNTDDEYGHRTSEDYYIAYWAEPQQEQPAGRLALIYRDGDAVVMLVRRATEAEQQQFVPEVRAGAHFGISGAPYTHLPVAAHHHRLVRDITSRRSDGWVPGGSNRVYYVSEVVAKLLRTLAKRTQESNPDGVLLFPEDNPDEATIDDILPPPSTGFARMAPEPERHEETVKRPEIWEAGYFPNKETEETFFWLNASERPIRNIKRLIREEETGYAADHIKALLRNQLLTNLRSTPEHPVYFANSQDLLKELVELQLRRIDYQFLAQHIGREDVAPWAARNN